MKKVIPFFAFIAAMSLSVVAFAGTNSNSETISLVNGKEGGEPQKKLTDNKYSFTLFNFFGSYSSSKLVSDSSEVEESMQPSEPSGVKTDL
ncbi:MAG: hypothetical protein RIC15_10295 [Vicingaceae bacterium]